MELGCSKNLSLCLWKTASGKSDWLSKITPVRDQNCKMTFRDNVLIFTLQGQEDSSVLQPAEYELLTCESRVTDAFEGGG